MKRIPGSCIPRGGNVFAAFLLTRDLMKRKKGDEDDNFDVFGESEDEFNDDELTDDDEFDEEDLEDDEFSEDDDFDDDEFGGEEEFEGDEDFDAFGDHSDSDR
jgi:hypothetical protein